MAFSGKTSAIADDWTFYNPRDPAFDQGAEDYDPEKALETREFDKYLPRKNGVTPWRFVLRRLTSRERRYLRDIGARDGSNMMAWWGIALALRKVVSPDGLEEQVDMIPHGAFMRCVDDWIDAIEDDGALFLSMGAAVINRELQTSSR